MNKERVLMLSAVAVLGVGCVFLCGSLYGTFGRQSLTAAAAAAAVSTSANCDTSSSHVINALCYGATGNGTTDDTAALETAINAAIAKKYPLLLPAGTYHVSSTIDINYAQNAGTGFQLISQEAILDGRSITAAPVLKIDCESPSATASNPVSCFYFEEQGPLTVFGKTSSYVVVVGTPSFADAQNGIKIDDLIVNNAGAGGGATQLNEVLASDIYTTSVGERVGLALEQTSFSKISGAAAGDASNGTGILIENGWSYSDTIYAMDLEQMPTCIAITSPHGEYNTFVSPYLNCNTGIAASAGTNNYFINPLWAGLIKNKTNGSTGVIFDNESNASATAVIPTAPTATAASASPSASILSSSLPVALPVSATPATPATPAVTPPAPTVSITADATSLTLGKSTTIHLNGTVGTGDTLLATTIKQTVNGATQSTSPIGEPDALTDAYTLTPTAIGVYTFYGYIRTNAHSDWVQAPQPVSVTVVSATPPATPSVTISADSTSIKVGQSTGIHLKGTVDPNDTLIATTINETLNGATQSTSPIGYPAALNDNYTFTPTASGTYTFYGYIRTDAFTNWVPASAPATVTVSS